MAVIGTLHAFDLLGPEGPISAALAFWTGDFVAAVVLGPLFGVLLLRLERRAEPWD